MCGFVHQLTANSLSLFALVTTAARQQNLASPDDEYEQHEQRFLGLLQKLLDIRTSLEHYRATALPLYSAACASLGADVWCVVSVDTVGKGTDAEKFRHAMCAINETKEVKNHFFNAVRLACSVGCSSCCLLACRGLEDSMTTASVSLTSNTHTLSQDEVLAGALRFLDIHINAMRSVTSQLAHRKRVKLDFDCYVRKLQTLQSASAQRRERNELKLARARETLLAVTCDLYRVFAKYESERDTMLNGELEMVRQVMHSFYARNAAATDFVIPEDVDRAALDAKTTQLYQAMVAKELAKQSVKALPAPSESGDDDESSETPETHDTLESEPHAAVARGSGALSEALGSPLAAMVAPVASATPAELVTAPPAPAVAIRSASQTPVAMALEDTNARVWSDAKASARTPAPQMSEDDLSEKLKTIQLSRPTVQPRKHSRWRSSA